MRHVLYIIMFFTTTAGLAQETGYQPGAVITRENERIEGLVKNVNLVPARILDDIKFKRSEDDKVTSYSARQITGYESGGDLFVSKKTEAGEVIFVKKLNTGKLRLYGKLVFDGSASYHVGYAPYIQLEADPVIHAVGQLTFRKQMLNYLKDAPGVCRLISEKKLKWHDIEVIVNLYNREADR